MTLQVQPGRAAFQAAQQQVLHRVQAQRPQPKSVLDSVVDLLVREMLQQPQHLHEFAFAPTPHASLQQPAQRPVLLGQLPPWQRGGLVQSRRLPLQQRQVVDGVEDKSSRS